MKNSLARWSHVCEKRHSTRDQHNQQNQHNNDVKQVLRYALEKFGVKPGSKGRLGFFRDKLVFNEVDEEQSLLIQGRIRNAITVLESNDAAIETYAHAHHANAWMGIDIPAELIDACLLAKKTDAIVLTDDYLCLVANAMESRTKIPDYCCTFVLMKVLLDKDLMSFEEYSNYFSYLAFYRCRFLGLSADDLAKATFGTGNIKIFQPENIRKFHLYLTLSEEYGVTLRTALRIIYQFLSVIIQDDTIPVDATNRVFSEVIPAFLKGRASDKREASALIPDLCKKQIETWEKNSRLIVPMNLSDEKLANLREQIALINSGVIII